MTHQELIDFCLTFPAADEDYPFDGLAAGDHSWAVMRHRGNKKSFALIYERGAAGCARTLNATPWKPTCCAARLSAVAPGYHMNKRHWNTGFC